MGVSLFICKAISRRGRDRIKVFTSQINALNLITFFYFAGVINLKFDLPEYPLLGNWTIMVQARQQIQNKTILVEQYFRPRFEVFVRLPYTFNVMDDYISGKNSLFSC